MIDFTKNFKFLLVNSVLTVGLLGLVGCGQSGPEISAVTGVVLVDGQPVQGVMVEFQPLEKGRPSIGYTDDSGRYKLRFNRERWGALNGDHLVRINYDWEEGSDVERPSNVIAKNYNDQSELKRTVTSGQKNVHDFSVTSQPTKKAKSQGRKIASN